MIKEVMEWVVGVVVFTMSDGEDGFDVLDEIDLDDVYEYDRALVLYGDREIDYIEATKDGKIRIEIL